MQLIPGVISSHIMDMSSPFVCDCDLLYALRLSSSLAASLLLLRLEA